MNTITVHVDGFPIGDIDCEDFSVYHYGTGNSYYSPTSLAEAERLLEALEND